MWSGDSKDEVAAVAHTNGSNENATEVTKVSDNPKVQLAPKERRNVRERSMSVPCRSEASDVNSVMTKAKRASSYLWMLLHSQNCSLGVDRCTHAGCADAKLVHLHMKTCSAGHDFPCPSRYEGCLQARKLLAHYRRCRNIRARQVGAPAPKGQHVCLICSMVARQARSLLDSNLQSSSKSSPVVAHKKSSNSSKCHVMSSFTVKAKLNAGAPPSKSDLGAANILASFTLSADNRSAKFFSQSDQPNPAGEWGMPPPARRPGVSKSAPSSPMGNCDRQELQGRGGSVKPSFPLFRKRSESLGGAPVRRGVSFAPRPEIFDEQPESHSLVAVELAPPEEDLSSKSRRGRSASCHILTTSSSPTGTCGTIYEEIGPPPSCMDE